MKPSYFTAILLATSGCGAPGSPPMPHTPPTVATVTPAAVPKPGWYPADFPLPAGWQQEGAAVSTPHATSAPMSWAMPVAELTAAYKAGAESAGWKLMSEQPRGMGGMRFRFEKGGRAVQLSLYEHAGRATAIVVPPMQVR